VQLLPILYGWHDFFDEGADADDADCCPPPIACGVIDFGA